MAVYTARKDRRTGPYPAEFRRGPTHRTFWHNQMWCGVKITGIATWNRDGAVEDVDCVKCLRAIRLNQPRAWRR